tara:strand:- start:10242 stop:12500 length:2259 start_codon:yes stop_codon:yes gene_type:complete
LISKLNDNHIVGYSNKLSVQPSEELDFMISCTDPKFNAEVVRLIHGDVNPNGPGHKDKKVPSNIDGSYNGKIQPIYSGSYIKINDSNKINFNQSFTFQTWIYLTNSNKNNQAIISQSEFDNNYEIEINYDGELNLSIENNDNKISINSGKRIRTHEWYFILIMYDKPSNTIYIEQKPLNLLPKDNSYIFKKVVISKYDIKTISGEILIGSSKNKNLIYKHFNGKIESPKIFGKILNHKQRKMLYEDKFSALSDESLIAFWSFSKNISSNIIKDVSNNHIDGITINQPARGMTGHNWDGTEINYIHKLEQYEAIYFHDDDLSDCNWKKDFTLKISNNWESGIYAVKLTTNDKTDYIPFFVRPPKGTHNSNIVFLVPTATYIAYANWNQKIAENRIKRYRDLINKPPPTNVYVQDHNEYIINNNLLSLYDFHSDGSGVLYSSRMRPMMNLRPGSRASLLGLGESAPIGLSADLHLIDWLENKGFKYDVITDEDLNNEGLDIIEPYKVVITGAHPEYWTHHMLNSLNKYTSNNGKLMYLGGNGFYWITSFDVNNPHILEVRRWHGTETYESNPGEYYHSTTGELGGIWKHRGLSPQKNVGVGFTSQGFDISIPYKILKENINNETQFIFEGIDEDELIGDYGLVMGGAAGFEIDRADKKLGTPDNAILVASAQDFSDAYQHAVEEIIAMNPDEGGSKNELVRSDMVYLKKLKGGAIFSVGSISWCGSLSYNNYNNNVSIITENVLKEFSSENSLP